MDELHSRSFSGGSFAKFRLQLYSRMLGQGVSDPYATIDFVADRALHRFKSFTVKDNLNPVWNFVTQVPVEDIATVSDINIKLFDKDEFTKD